MDWIKIMCNILDHRKIKMIRKGPEGNTLVLLWLLMLTEAGKCNRGGYLMISDSLPYTVDTLSMVMDIPLPTVQLGLVIFADLDMIDSKDGAIFIKNWTKYQSEDKLEARREKERLRQQRHRQKERDKLRALPSPEQASRDSNVSMSRDVTQENRQDKSREDKTTDQIRFLLSGTPLVKISDRELSGLEKRHGPEQLLRAADIAAETWRRNREDKHNPGGYLNFLCSSLVIPDWYVSFEERIVKTKRSEHRKKVIESEQAAFKIREEAKNAAMDELWDSLPEEKREQHRKKAIASLPKNIVPSMTVTTVLAKLLAWEEAQPCTLPMIQDHSAVKTGNPCERNCAQIPAQTRDCGN